MGISCDDDIEQNCMWKEKKFLSEKNELRLVLSPSEMSITKGMPG